jgi:hypothetical protein
MPTPLVHLKGAVGTAHRRPNSPSDRTPPLSELRRRLTSHMPVPTTPSSMFGADCRCLSVPPSLSGRLRHHEVFHGERSPSPLHPHARRVASPPWVLESRLLLRLCHCSTTAGRATTRAQRAVTAPVCAHAASRRHGPRPARQAVGRARCAHRPSQHCGSGPRGTVQLGQVRFRPCGSRISFPFSKYIQIIANLKICVGFI